MVKLTVLIFAAMATTPCIESLKSVKRLCQGIYSKYNQEKHVCLLTLEKLHNYVNTSQDGSL